MSPLLVSAVTQYVTSHHVTSHPVSEVDRRLWFCFWSQEIETFSDNEGRCDANIALRHVTNRHTSSQNRDKSFPESASFVWSENVSIIKVNNEYFWPPRVNWNKLWFLRKFSQIPISTANTKYLWRFTNGLIFHWFVFYMSAQHEYTFCPWVIDKNLAFCKRRCQVYNERYIFIFWWS